MQRISTMVTLILFMFMLSWVAKAFPQQEPLSRDAPQNVSPLPEEVEAGDKYTPETIALPHRNGENPDEPAAPRCRPGKQKPAIYEETPRAPHVTSEAELYFPATAEGCIHFLLLGRAWDSKEIIFLMIVTLFRGSHAILTAVEPAYPAEHEGIVIPVGKLLHKGGDYDDLCRLISQITGLEPQFFIDLNIYGFMEMIEMLGGVDPGVYQALSKSINAVDLGGEEILRRLTDPGSSARKKEMHLTALLITAGNIRDNTLVLRLLWTGYRNIHSNLGLSDLLKIRRVTQDIPPTRVSFREIKIPGS